MNPQAPDRTQSRSAKHDERSRLSGADLFVILIRKKLFVGVRLKVK